MLKTARIKLTFWYVIVIMLISIFFSSFIYVESTKEFDRALRMQEFRQNHPEIMPRIIQRNVWEEDILPRYPQPDPLLLEEARMRVFESLIGINIIIFLFSSLAGYFLAGRTLRPIKVMMDEQNRFITDSSHELRTPLTALRSEIEVSLRSKNLNLEKSRDILESNLEEVINLQILVDNLLELSQNGKLVNKSFMEELSVESLIDEAIKKTSSLARVNKIKIVNKVKNVAINGVVDRLIEVFVILIDNAIKYSSQNSTIEIYSKQNKNEVKIFIKDSGIGIAKEDLPYVFDRFYRAEKSRTKKGYGLGLSIAKKIIESHAGSIAVSSDESKGSIFTVTLSCI